MNNRELTKELKKPGIVYGGIASTSGVEYIPVIKADFIKHLQQLEADGVAMEWKVFRETDGLYVN